MLHGQSDVIGGDGEEALQLRVCTQVDSVGLQESPQSATAHILHDENVRLCVKQNTLIVRDLGDLWLMSIRFIEHYTVATLSVLICLSPSVVFQSSNCRMFL